MYSTMISGAFSPIVPMVFISCATPSTFSLICSMSFFGVLALALAISTLTPVCPNERKSTSLTAHSS